MDKKLQNLYLKLEKQKNEIIDLYNNSSFDKIVAAPAKGKWSSVQILEHIVLVELLTVKNLNLRIDHSKHFRDVNLLTKIRGSLLSFALRSSLKFKAPTFVANISADVNLDDVKRKWQNNRLDLLYILDKFPQDLLDKEVFKHPVAGWLDIYQTLEFLEQHVEHHIVKVKSYLKN